MTLRSIRETCVPREDVVRGGLPDNHFAAQLDKVVRDAGNYPVYGDAEEFFALTYPTAGLKTLLTKTFGRLTAKGGVAAENGVLRSATSFGGGKTHGLTAVYHLAKGARPSNIDEFLGASLLPEGPVQVAALVGDELDPTAGLQTGGHHSYTLWGEMAAQLGDHAWSVLSANDADRQAPGKTTIADAFGGKPTVIIIDEIAQHLRSLAHSGNEDVRRMAGAVPVFLKNLFEVAADPTNRVVVIITLASATNAFGAETTEISDLFGDAEEETSRAIDETAEVLTRTAQASSVIRPAEDAEIGEILKRRLFKTIDSGAAREAAFAYQSLYEGLIQRSETLAGGPEQPVSYAEAIERSYPFHPELVRVLDKRLGDIPRFQRARGALKLLAEVIAGIYRKKAAVEIINVADVDYSNEAVLNHLTENIGKSEFEGVARADIAGTNSHAASVDENVFAATEPYATRVGRTVLTHSLESKTNAGAGRNDWLVGTLRPGEDPAVLEKALAELEKVAWHLGYDGARWRFSVEPNVNKIIEEEKKNVPNTRVAQMVDDLIARAFPNDGGVSTIIYPSGPADVPDTNSLRVVVVDSDVVTIESGEAERAPALIQTMLETSGSAGTPRRYRNSAVYAAADEILVDGLRDRARGLIAAEQLAQDSARLAEFSPEIRTKIEALEKQARLDARIAVNRAYKHVYYPTADKAHGNLRHRDLPAQGQGDAKKTTTAIVLDLLKDEGKVRTQPLSASYLQSKAWPETKASITTQELADWFWIDHGVDIIREPGLLKEAILNGIRNNGWVYYDGASGKAYTATSMGNLQVEFRADAELMTVEEATGRGLLVRKPAPGDVRKVFVPDVMSGAELRTALEAECGGEPSKADVLEALATAVQSEQYDGLVVTDVEPTAGVRALTPSDIRAKGLDSLSVMSRSHADGVGVEVPGRVVVGKTFTSSGPGGAAIQHLLDQVADHTITAMKAMSVKVTADAVRGSADVDLLAAALGMLPKSQVKVVLELTAEFPGVSGGARIQASADKAGFQQFFGNAQRLVKTASKVSGSLTLAFVFSEPVDASSTEISQIKKVLRDLQLGHTEMTAEVGK